MCMCQKTSVCAHSFTETPTNVGSSTLRNHSSQQKKKANKKEVFTQAIQRALKSRLAAFTQQQQPYLFLNNTVFSLCDKLSFLHIVWGLRKLGLHWLQGLFHNTEGCFKASPQKRHSNLFKLLRHKEPCAAVEFTIGNYTFLILSRSSLSWTTKDTVHDENHNPCLIAKFCL